MSTPTPGPWKFGLLDWSSDKRRHEVLEKPFDYVGPGHYQNPSVFGETDGKWTEVVGCDEYYVFSGKADVRLIVSAPDLLEVVRDIVSDCKGHINPGLYEAAEKALAKATGKV